MDRVAATENQSLLSVQALPGLHGLAMAAAPKSDAPPRQPITGKRNPVAAERTQRRVSILRLMNGPSNIFLNTSKCCSDSTCWLFWKIQIRSSSLIISRCVFYCRVGCYWLWLHFRRYCFQGVWGVAWLFSENACTFAWTCDSECGFYGEKFGEPSVCFFFPKEFQHFFFVCFVSISMQMLQAEVSRLHHRLESCLKERERLASASETTVRENHHHPRTFTPRVRLVVLHLM